MIALLPVIKATFFDNTGKPLAGGRIYFFEPGSTTPKSTFTDAGGLTPQTQPVILDSAGRANIWLSGLYNIIVKTSADVTLYSTDNVSAAASATVTFSEWVIYSGTVAFVGATQFSTPGDQTTTFQVGMRVKATVTAGTVYGTITASTYGAGTTTVTIVADSGALDSGLSAIQIGFLTMTNRSIPVLPTVTKTADYSILAADAGRTIIANKATAIAFTLPVTSVSKVFTVSSASPAVFSSATHTFSINDLLRLTTTGALYTGLAINTAYYIIATGFTADAFQVSLSLGGAAVNTSGSQSGTHTAVKETASVANGTKFEFKNIGAGVLTLTGTVDGRVNPTLAQGDMVTVTTDGVLYYGKVLSVTPAANVVPITDPRNTLKAFSLKDHGTQATSYALDLSLADIHIVAFSGTATLTISATNTNEKGLVIIKNNNYTITLAGIDVAPPTLTKAASTQDYLALIKSFGKIACVSSYLNSATT